MSTMTVNGVTYYEHHWMLTAFSDEGQVDVKCLRCRTTQQVGSSIKELKELPTWGCISTHVSRGPDCILCGQPPTAGYLVTETGVFALCTGCDVRVKEHSANPDEAADYIREHRVDGTPSVKSNA